MAEPRRKNVASQHNYSLQLNLLKRPTASRRLEIASEKAKYFAHVEALAPTNITTERERKEGGEGERNVPPPFHARETPAT